MFKSVKSKVIFAVLSLSILGLISISYYLSSTLSNLSNTTSKQSLSMLSESIYQTMTTSMMLGDPQVVESTLHTAKSIDGIDSLTIAKSKAVLEVYAPTENFTTNPILLDVLQNKKTMTIEKDVNGHHTIRMIRPMVAEKRCLSCHYNAEVGYTLGAMDLVLSLDKNDATISKTNMTLILSLLVSALLFAIIVGMFFVKEIFTPLDMLKEKIADLVRGDKDLTKRLAHKKGNEFGDAAEEVNHFIATIQETINIVKDLGKENSNIATEIDISVSTIVQSINDVSDKMHQNANNVEALSTANRTSVVSIESDLIRLVEVASRLQNTIDEFKS